MISAQKEITPAEVASHYDELDRFYREVWGEHVHHGLWRRGNETRSAALRALVQLVAHEARIKRGVQVCDIGCGYGATARMLAGEYGAEVTAVTVSPAQYQFASERAGAAANPSFLLADWQVNELPAAAFDAAIAIESSEHMADKAAFFLQAFRVLRRDGRLVVCAWLAADQPKDWQKRWLLEPICREGRLPHLGTVEDYENFATEAGFIFDHVEDVTEQVARTWPMIVRTFLLKLVSRPDYLRFLFNRQADNRVFAGTIFRIWLAYRTGAMRYAVFTLRK